MSGFEYQKHAMFNMTVLDGGMDCHFTLAFRIQKK
jgi:hypothetical protein